MLVAHDFPGADAARLAALVFTTLGLARQVVKETGRGEFRGAITRGSAGYLMVYTAGDSAVVAIVAGEQTQAGIMQYEARRAIAKIASYANEFPSWSPIDARLPLNTGINPDNSGPGSLPKRGIPGLPLRQADCAIAGLSGRKVSLNVPI